MTITDNRIIGIVGTEIAKMTKQKPAFQVVPVTAESSDVQAAQTGERILDFLWKHLYLRNRLEDVLLWSRICGAGFWKVCWDSTKGQKVTIVVDGEGSPVIHGETGAPMVPGQFEGGMPEGLNERTIATGDVHVETVSPFDVLPDPLARSFEECEWVIQQAVKSTEYVKQHYEVELAPDTDVTSGPTEARMFPSTPGGTSGMKGVKIWEYWCKPNSQHAEGRRVVWAQGKILQEGANPYRSLPFVMFKGVPVPGRLWPSSRVEQLRGPQALLNKVESQIVENAQRIGNPALLKSRQANVQYSGVPGEVIEFDDTVPNAVPSYLQPPQMPQYVLSQQDRTEASMQDISGQHEVSNAQVPAGVKAASAINLLQEADDTRLGPAIYAMEEELGRAGTMMLKIVAEYWTDERVVMIAGEDHALDAMAFKGAALKENTKAEVQEGSMFPQSKAAKQAAIQDVLGLYFQYGDQEKMNPRAIGKVLKDMEAGALGKLFGDLSVDESQINRENQEISQGEPLPVNPYDNHQAHVEGHTEFQKGATYLNLPPEVTQMMERHVAEHREQIAEMTKPSPPPVKPVVETLNYKDAPPDVRRQIEEQADLEPSQDEKAEPVEHPQAPEPPKEAKPNEP